MIKKISVIVIGLLFLSGCIDKTNKNLIKNNDQQLEAMVVEGKTTKEEVEKMFGKPTTIGSDIQGREQWVYSHTETSMNPMNYVPVTKLLIGQDGKVRTLVIIFEKNIVYKVNAETEKGQRVKKGLLTMGS